MHILEYAFLSPERWYVLKVFILKRKFLIFAAAIAVFFMLTLLISVSRAIEKKIPIYSVERADNKIALTFNCAWGDEDIDSVLNTLEKNKTHATFFVVGTWAEKYPEALKKIYKSGHEIGAHSYNHAHYQKMCYSDILADIEKCDAIIENIIGSDINLVRGGYGEYSNDVLDICENTGRTYIQWSLDSLDYKASSAEDILNRLKKVQNGDIILMHTGTEYTSSALDALISELGKNHEFATVSEIIYPDGFTIDPTGRQFKKE